MSSAYTLDALLAREEIADVVKRLARGTDRLDEALIAACYHPDGVDDHNAFRGDGAAFARWVMEVLPHFEATMHFVGPPRIRTPWPGTAGNGLDTAKVDTYCVAHHLSRPDDAGQCSDMVLGLRYVDRFERRDGRWLIAARVCAFDWSYTIPFDPARGFQFESTWTLGARDRTDVTYQEDQP
jgi:hypothetical protein